MAAQSIHHMPAHTSNTSELLGLLCHQYQAQNLVLQEKWEQNSVMLSKTVIVSLQEVDILHSNSASYTGYALPARLTLLQMLLTSVRSVYGLY